MRTISERLQGVRHAWELTCPSKPLHCGIGQTPIRHTVKPGGWVAPDVWTLTYDNRNYD
jgi:hypothetical protein